VCETKLIYYKKIKNMDQRIINLFDEYTHKPLDRKEFIKQLVVLTGSTAAAMTILPLLEVNYAKGAIVSEHDDEIITEDITYPGADGLVKGYLAKPKGKGKYGTVVVIHENRGLNPHIQDVTRRVAKAGYIALAPDALSASGGTPANEDEARTLIGKLDPATNLSNFIKALDYLRNYKNSNKKTGVVGFCWGGGLTNQLVVHDPNLNVAVAFYGKQPDAAEVKNIKAFVQLHYGGLDERINAGIPAYEEALKAAGIKYQLYIYPDVQHSFHNDTAPTRYNEAAARLAWERTLLAFKENLK
jgi:carboxymethylenebutenolidase